jgi:hypothetical protein
MLTAGAPVWAQTGGGPSPDQQQVTRTLSKAPDAEVPHSALTDAGVTIQAVTIRLDNTGVASWSYRNIRNPPLIRERDAPLTGKFRLRFVNDTSGATVKVALPSVEIPGLDVVIDGLTKTLEPLHLLGEPEAANVPTGATKEVQEAAEKVAQEEAKRKQTAASELIALVLGVTVEECQGVPKQNDETTRIVKCVPSVTVSPSGEGWVDWELLRMYPKGSSIKFVTSFPFALDSEQPTNPGGYFSIDKVLKELPNTVTLTANGSFVFAREPYFGAPGTFISAETPYEGARVRQVRTTARTAVAYTLADRASALVEVQFKNSQLGRKDEDLAAKVNQYHFQIFGLGGTSIKFGRYLFAAPTDGLAINEVGEGVTARYKWFGLSHIIKREGASGTPDPNDDDHVVWIGEATNLALRSWGALRSLSLYGLLGVDDAPERARRYHTLGGEAHFMIPTGGVTGTLAYYASRSRPSGDSPARRARGDVWLARTSKTWFSGTKAMRTTVITMAGATGDASTSNTRYEGYLGESASWVPDGSLFASGVLPRSGAHAPPYVLVDRAGNPVLDKDGRTTPEFVHRGISNYRVASIVVSDLTVSPLEWIAAMFDMKQGEVKSRLSSFRLQYYRPTEQVGGFRDASLEAQLEFMMEAPAGIKTIVKISKVFGGRSLESVLKKEPYALLVQTNVAFK